MKLCKKCKQPKDHNNSLISLCKSCTYEKQNLNPSKVKGIKKISDKKKERLRTTGGEKLTFEKVYKERKNCIICNKYVSDPQSWCFAHILSKKTIHI